MLYKYNVYLHNLFDITKIKEKTHSKRAVLVGSRVGVLSLKIWQYW
jgi:hypothetical protein